MILVIDNYDSFAHNLARYIRQLGLETVVIRNDEVDQATVAALAPDAIVISPGPCTPNEAGYSIQLVNDFVDKTPILGICLGHQVIAQALGGTIVRAYQPVHGRQSKVAHTHSNLFKGIPSSFMAGRYHSLVVDLQDLPTDLEITARTEDGLIMAIEHTSRAIVGIQFHPESILTEHGYQLLFNFFAAASIDVTLPDAPSMKIVPNSPERSFQTSDRLSIKELS